MQQPTYASPGIYQEIRFTAPAAGLRTAVPLFLGLISEQAFQAHPDGLSRRALPPNDDLWLVRAANLSSSDTLPESFTRWSEFESQYGALAYDGFLSHAVRGFFENGGDLCFVQIICYASAASPVRAVSEGLRTIEGLDAIDLVCVPDILWPLTVTPPAVDRAAVLAVQTAVLSHCDTLGDRFAILDALPGATLEGVLQQRRELSGPNAALYYPWVKVMNGPSQTGNFVPPCGHVAGVYARSDKRAGVHKAPANESLEGVSDLETSVTNAQQGELNPEGINCLRAFPGRGIRVWGARTLSRDPNWIYVNVRRLFLTAGRWIERHQTGIVFEPNDAMLWARITRELTAYFNTLFQRGALQGRTAQEAFHVKCDAETNPPEVRNAGRVVAEIGLAPAVPGEFIVVRITHTAGGVTIETT